MIKLVFSGRPMSKDNEKVFNKQGRFFLSAKYKQYEASIQYQFNNQKPAGFTLFTKDVIMTMRVYFEDKRCLDLQNVPKSVCDALKSFLYKDDKQISELHLYKYFDKNNPRIEIDTEEKNI